VRARWVKPEFFEDQKMAEIGPIGALVYQALWVSADDTGMAMCDPDLLKGRMFARWSAVGVPEITGALRKLSELVRVRFLTGGDELFAEIIHWKENQPVHKPSKFTYREDYAKRGKELQETVPEWCGTSEAPVRESPPPRHLDSQTPSGRGGSKTLAMQEATSNPPTTTTTRAKLREQLTAEGQDALDGLIKARAQPEALVGECTMILAGERQIKPKPTPEGLSLALCDLRTNNQRPTARSLRTYTADAMRQLTDGISTQRGGDAWDKAIAEAEARENANAH